MKTLLDLKDALREAITDLDLSHDGTRVGRENAIFEMKQLGDAFADLFACALASFADNDGGSNAAIEEAGQVADAIRDTLHAARWDLNALDDREQAEKKRADDAARAAAWAKIKAASDASYALGGVDNSGLAPC